MSEYKITGVEIQDGSYGYAVGDELTVDLNTTDGKLTVTSIDEPAVWFITSGAVSGTMSGYVSGETVSIYHETFTITAVEGVVTALTGDGQGYADHNVTGEVVTSEDYTYEGSGTGLVITLTSSELSGGTITGVSITNAGSSSTSTVENPVSLTGGTGINAAANITLSVVIPFEKVEVTDVPGTMPKPATEVSYVDYDVTSVDVPIDYNTTFTREYPVA